MLQKKSVKLFYTLIYKIDVGSKDDKKLNICFLL